MGREPEHDAYALHSAYISSQHLESILEKSGLIIGELPYLGASPDSILINQSKELVGLLEIKSPFSAAKLTVSEACEQLDKFYLHKDDNGTYSLDPNHAYFYQVQGSMSILNVNLTDFVVWTPSSFEIIHIEYDPIIWKDKMLPNLTEFYNRHMLPAILY